MDLRFLWHGFWSEMGWRLRFPAEWRGRYLEFEKHAYIVDYEVLAM